MMRTTREENTQLGHRLAEKLNLSTGPLTVLLPLRGNSLISAPAAPFTIQKPTKLCSLRSKADYVLTSRCSNWIVRLTTPSSPNCVLRGCSRMLRAEDAYCVTAR